MLIKFQDARRRIMRVDRLHLSKLTGAALPALLVGAAFVLAPTSSGVQAQSPEIVAIQRVVTGALTAETQADIRPVGIPTGQNVPDSAVKTAAQNVAAMTAAQVNAWSQRLQATLSNYYTGTRLKQLSNIMLAHALEQTGAGVHDIQIGGGVEGVNFHSIQLAGDSATVSVEASKWGRYVHVGGGRADIIGGQPSDAQYDLRLVRTVSGWRIAEETGFQILTNAP